MSMSLSNWRRTSFLSTSLCLGISLWVSLTGCFVEDLPSGKFANPIDATKAADSVTDYAGKELQNETQLSSKQILAEVASTYQKCTSYRDSGLFESKTTRNDGSEWSHLIAFRTAFQRDPQKFRFAYRQNYYDQGYREPTILWHDRRITMIGEEETNIFEKQTDLGRAVARLTGVSSSTSHNISALLMPNQIGGRRLVELSNLKPPQIEKIAKDTCYRLEGLYADEKMILWINTETFLITKIESHMTIRGKLKVYNTTHTPEINKKLAASLFEKQVVDEWKGLDDHDDLQRDE